MLTVTRYDMIRLGRTPGRGWPRYMWPSAPWMPISGLK